jgi:hypothetical protein
MSHRGGRSRCRNPPPGLLAPPAGQAYTEAVS